MSDLTLPTELDGRSRTTIQLVSHQQVNEERERVLYIL